MELVKDRLDLTIIDTVFDPDVYGIEPYPRIPPENVLDVRYHKSGSSSLYKIWIYLAGYDLPFVDNITYQLHSSFENPYRRVERNLTNPDCRLVIWTWGIFQINGTILDKSGRTYSISHHLNYGNLLKEFQSRNDVKINYIEDKPDSRAGATLIAS